MRPLVNSVIKILSGGDLCSEAAALFAQVYENWVYACQYHDEYCIQAYENMLQVTKILGEACGS